MSLLLKTTVTVYPHSMIYSLIFIKQRRFWCLYSISICVLSGCGGNTVKPTSKQNSCRFFSLTISLSLLLSLSLCLLIPCSSLSTLFFFFLPPIRLSLSSPSRPACGPAPAVPGKSWLWYPRKTSQREQRTGRWGASSSAHLLHSRQFFEH